MLLLSKNLKGQGVFGNTVVGCSPCGEAELFMPLKALRNPEKAGHIPRATPYFLTKMA